MFKYEISETHDFLFFRIDIWADFNKLPNLFEFEDQLDTLITDFINQLVKDAENKSEGNIDPINGFWNTEDCVWEEGWFEGNLDKKRDRSYHFPDPTPALSADNGSNGDSYLCPRDLLDQFKINFNNSFDHLEIEYLFLNWSDAAKDLVKQISKLYNRHLRGESDDPKTKLLNSIIVQLSTSSLSAEEVVSRAKQLVNVAYGTK